MNKTILCVDDSSSIRQVVGFTLRGAGYSVVEAVDGADALRKLDQTMHLVVTDLNMPNLNGIELVKQIRANGPNKFLPIILLTTESQESKRAEGRSAGATGWIVKPFRPEQLLAVVKKVLG